MATQQPTRVLDDAGLSPDQVFDLLGSTSREVITRDDWRTRTAVFWEMGAELMRRLGRISGPEYALSFDRFAGSIERHMVHPFRDDQADGGER